jgi:endonuclease G
VRRSRKKSSAGRVFPLLLALVVLGLLLRCTRAAKRADDAWSSWPSPGARNSPVATSVHVALGVPADDDPSDDYLMDEKQYVLSYNPKKNVANWVSWNLNSSHLGSAHRKNDFRQDRSLPAEFYHVAPKDYLHCGYDRGHLCPSKDRSKSPEDNATTFLMVNMQPQLHELNAGPWEKLEEHERRIAEEPGVELYIVAGGVFGEPSVTIGHGIAVPRASYKIIAVLRAGQKAADVKPETEIVAVIMPNEPGVGVKPWTEYLVSVRDVEAATRYDFLSNVPAAVQDAIETRVARVP